MTKVEVWLVDNTTKRICVSGHSGYADEGSDIVCSAISTAVMLTSGMLEDVCPEYIINTNSHKAIIDIEVKQMNDMSNIVMKNLYRTLDEISKQYPKYVCVRINK